MAGRPAKICKLVKGKLIDAQAGFVDTFNWMLDFIDNLKGEGELGVDGSDLKVDKTVSDRPVIRGGNTGSTHADKTLVCGNDSNITFTISQANPNRLLVDVYYV